MEVEALTGRGLPEGYPDFLTEQGVTELYPPQAEAVEAGVLSGENIVASVPTASGKTLIAELAMLASIREGRKALYIVPLRALASEKATEFERLERFDVTVGVATGNYQSDGDWLRASDIVVATSEKVDSLLRNDASWIRDIGCVVADEIHLVDDASRGPTLEVTLAKLRRAVPSVQVVGLSATIGNAGSIADWLDATLIDSTWRPIELRRGVHYGVAINYADGSTREVPARENERQTAAIVRDTLEDGGSTLVFVNSRRNAEAAAKRLARTVEESLADDERERLEETAREVRAESSTDTSEDLGAVVERGAAFHHAGLSRRHRTLIEDAFRDRDIKVVAATPTLAAGVNTPSRRVVVRDWRRYDATVGGMAPLETLEVHQMFGRAGRPGRDPYGEAVLLADDHGEMQELFDRYIYADPEPVRSKLAAEPALRTHVLATVATGVAHSRTALVDFLEETLYAHQSGRGRRLADVADAVLEYLLANQFLERDGDGLRATRRGHLVSELYLDPMSAAEIIDGIEAGSDRSDGPSVLGLYQLVCRTPDMYQLYLRSGDRERYTEIAYEKESELLGDAPSEFADTEWEDWLSALKTARLLEDWANELEEDTIANRYGVGPGDIRGKVETASWLLGAAERLAGELGLGVAPAVRRARRRVEDGVSAELLDLTGIRGVGRKRARWLHDAGIEDRAALRAAETREVLTALKGRTQTAERILENAGHPSPSIDGSGESSPTEVLAGGSPPDQEPDSNQAGLGDFE